MKVFENHSLLGYNTFKMEVVCRQFIDLESPDELKDLAAQGGLTPPYYVLGGGSNVLFTRDYEGCILHPVFQGVEIVEEDAQSVTLRVAAGTEWEDLINYCLEHHLYGLENLTGIPGLVGSAPVQNIGAYGVEVKDCILAVEGYHLPTATPFRYEAADCRFGYRTSLFKTELKGRCFITYVWFKLGKEPHFTLTYKALTDEMARQQLEPSLENVVRCVRSVRDSKLPDITEIGCAGSFFQNPVVPAVQAASLKSQIPDLVSYPAGEGVKLAAGQLIDKAGWKGYREGDAGIYPKQALVVVNYGHARPEEIKQLYEKVISDVNNKFHITLQPEVNIL
ncbi:MAG: UDP-N-acetylmuramate dehydrogenase [Bacteroidales bacterium]|nr:UDP-N-acetylmuramate dehydrogenase [Bacteroidales bacterium]